MDDPDRVPERAEGDAVPTTPSATLSDRVRVRLRELRESRNLSISELGRRASVSKATISELEAADANPTLATLEALATALQVPLAELLVPGSEGSAEVVRRDDPERAQANLEALAGFHCDGRVEVYELRYGPASTTRFRAHRHGTIERLVVVRGRVTAGPEDEPVDGGEGDLITYRADAAHVLATGPDPVEALLVVQYPAERDGQVNLHGRSRRR